MKIYNVGSDALPQYIEREAEERFVWFVYDYKYDGIEGGGEAVGLDPEGLLHCYNLDHCSYDGPIDDIGREDECVSLDEFLKPKESVHDWNCSQAIRDQVARLVAERI